MKTTEKKMSYYTPEITEEIKNAYLNGGSILELSEKYQIPEKSIIAKLSSLKVYKRKIYTNKLGEPPIKKEEYIEQLASLLGVSIDTVGSLEKVNKNVLKLLRDVLRDCYGEDCYERP